MINIVKDKIEKIVFFPKREAFDYYFFPEEVIKPWFGKPKYYPDRVIYVGDMIFNDRYSAGYTNPTNLSFEKDKMCVENGKVYYYPYFKIHLTSGGVVGIDFETEELAIKWFEKEIGDLKLIEI